MNKKSVVLAIDGTEGIFKVDKSVNLFWEHTTQDGLKDIIKSVVKEVRKLSKGSQVMLDITESENYHRTPKYRFIVHSLWSGIELDVRKYNGHDFSDSDIYKFVSENDMFKYLTKQVSSISENIMGHLPASDTYYGQYTHDKEGFKECYPDICELIEKDRAY